MHARTCDYVKPDGHLCGSLALRGRDYCHFHVTSVPRERRAATQRAIAEGPPLELPPLRDLNSVQIALMRVMNGLLQGRISSRMAGQLLYALQLARTNLARAMYLPVEEVTAVQITLMRVMHDLVHRRINTRAAGQLLFAVQLAMTSLKECMEFPVEEQEPVYPKPC